MAVGSVLFGKFWQRLVWFLGFGLLYGGGAIIYAHWTKGSYVIWLLLTLLISRTVTLVFLRDKKGTILMMQRSVIGMFLLLITAFICLLPVPGLGITEDIRYAAFGGSLDGLTEHPQRTILWGVVYFALMACVEFYAGWRLPDWTDEQAEAGWKVLQQ